MCFSYIIDGKRCETGNELADAIGIENARKVNPNFLSDTSEKRFWESCLCHVNRKELHRVTGKRYELDFERDAFVPADMLTP